MDAKTKSIVSHLTLIGWIIAFVLNQPGENKEKHELTSFYLRQNLGIIILGFVSGIIPFLNLFLWIIPLVLWIISLIGSFNGEEKLVPLVGSYFQDWFKAVA